MGEGIAALWAAYGAYAIAAAKVIAVMAASMVVNAIIRNNSGNSKSKSQQDEQNRGLANTIDTQVALPVVYGRRRIGINKVFMGVKGDDNRFLYIVGTLCEGEIEGIVVRDGVEQVFLDDKLYNTFGQVTEYGRDPEGNICWTKVDSPAVEYWFHNGSATQTVDPVMAAAFPEWDSALRYTAYIVVKLTYSQDIFQSVPNITVEVDGLKIYNPDTELTEYSNDPSLCSRDFLTRSSRRGGLGISADRNDDEYTNNAATYCSAKGWTCDILFNDKSTPAIDNLKDLLNCFRGSVIRSGSKFRIQYRDLNYESAVMDLTEDDVIETGGFSSLKITQPSIFNTPNAVNMKFINADNQYASDEYVLADPDALESDGDYRENEINVPGITNLTNVQKMANYFLERLRVNKNVDMVIGSRGMSLEPEDVVTLTHSRPGWTKKLLRVTQPSISQNGEVGLALEEEGEGLYDDDYNLEERTFHDTNLPDPSVSPAIVINVTHEEEVYNYRGRSFTRWNIKFDRPLPEVYPFWRDAKIYIKIGADGGWKFMTNAVADYQLDPVEEGKEYFCNIISVSVWGSEQYFDDGYLISRVIQGKTELPGNLTALTALAHGDSVSIYADPLMEPDIAGYEVRLGSGWVGGLFIGFNETPNLRLAGVRPGTHTFWMAAKDNSGHYSASPVAAQVTVFYPANYVNKNTWSWDFNGIGTFTNTEHVTYDGSDALKCSHTDGNLTGTWLSPEYDLGSIKTVRIWGDFITSFYSGSQKWEVMFAAGKTWAEVMATGKRWYEVLSPEYSGIIQAKLKWGISSGSLTYEATKLEILAPEITARYVQFEITIIDPDNGSNLYLRPLNNIAAYWS